MHIKLTYPKLSWLFWHRWLGMLSCVGILLWAVSGISHPIMSRLQPKPVSFSAPNMQFDLEKAQFIKPLLEQVGISDVQHVSLAQLNGHDYYRVSVNPNEPARYFDVSSGDELANADALYAQFLAQHFTGLGVDGVIDVALVTAFDDDYHEVNRLLPVWRITYGSNQHLRAYIDTEQSRLATLVNDTRYWLTQLFQFGHNWSFLERAPFFQVSIAACVLCAVLISALSGLYLYFKLGNAKQRLADKSVRRWHRRLGLMVALSALLFSSSGLFHLIMSYQQQQAVVMLAIESAPIRLLDENVWEKVIAKPLVKLDLISHQQQLYWHILPLSESDENQMPVSQVAVLAKEAKDAEHHTHHPHAGAQKAVSPYLLTAQGNSVKEPIASIEDFAKAKALSLTLGSQSQVESTKWITRFKDEYGFIFKRLPVIKVQMKDAENTRYYIEPVTGALAAKVRDIDGVEGFVFAYLHKWSFGFLNKDVRDILVSLFALGNIVVALMGFTMFFRRYRR